MTLNCSRAGIPELLYSVPLTLRFLRKGPLKPGLAGLGSRMAMASGVAGLSSKLWTTKTGTPSPASGVGCKGRVERFGSK